MTTASRLQRLFSKPLDEVVTNNNKKADASKLFIKHELHDPWVVKTIALIAKHEGRPVAEVTAEITENVQSLVARAGRSAALHGINVEMAVEKTLFEYFAKDASDFMQKVIEKIMKGEITSQKDLDALQPPSPLQAKGAPEFDPVIFMSLVRRTKIENPSMFPLRNPFKKKPITSPRIILVPAKDKEDQKWNEVDTAAATPGGEFIFSVPFMQNCMNYSHARGQAPKGAKFVSNGGNVPDEYAMLEFLIMHEFYHYTHGDFYRGNTYVDEDKEKSNHRVANYTEDFRSNYDLVKAGYEPIPMGLYSKHVNYDNLMTYNDMYMMVKREMQRMDALPKVGDVVTDKKGNHHVVEKITSNGEKVETRPAKPEEVAYANANKTAKKPVAPPAKPKKP